MFMNTSFLTSHKFDQKVSIPLQGVALFLLTQKEETQIIFSTMKRTIFSPFEIGL